jgi:hypothetical protein
MQVVGVVIGSGVVNCSGFGYWLGFWGGGEPISGFGGGYTCMCMRGCVEHHILVLGGLGG